ncbi:MAG: helix-hairpin-helix domain-containing protein [Chloroflexota bacterium]
MTDSKINLNEADVATLAALNGIGDVLAERIVAYREAHGGFKTVGEITAVSDIADHLLDELGEQLTVQKPAAEPLIVLEMDAIETVDNGETDQTLLERLQETEEEMTDFMQNLAQNTVEQSKLGAEKLRAGATDVSQRVRAGATDASQQVMAGAAEATQRVKAGADNVSQRVLGWWQRDNKAAADFRLWAATLTHDSLPDESNALANWLISASDDEMKVLCERAADFCEDMGFELAWLTDGDFDSNPMLKAQLTQAVYHFCLACQQGRSAHGEIWLHTTMQNWLSTPFSRKHRAMTQHVVSILAEQGIIKTPSYLLLAEQKEREGYIEGVLRETAVSHSNELSTALKAVQLS